MSFPVAESLNRMVRDGDNALVASDLEEYYLDNGAAFTVIGCMSLSLTTNADMRSKQQVEFCVTPETGVRVFSENISTLSNSFETIIYEMPARLSTTIPSSEGRAAVVMNPNRINNRAPAFDAVVLSTDGGFWIEPFTTTATYSTGDYVRRRGIVYQATSGHGASTFLSTGWTTQGEVVDIQQFIMEAKGGPQSADAGSLVKRASFVQLNTKEHNYLLEVHNTDTTGRDFGLQVTVGANDMLP